MRTMTTIYIPTEAEAEEIRWFRREIERKENELQSLRDALLAYRQRIAAQDKPGIRVLCEGGVA